MGQILIIFIDFESTGLDPTFDRIVEFAALAVVGPIHTPGASFSTVVGVDPDFLQNQGTAAAIHGISAEEIMLGPSFSCVWGRFLDFVDHLVNSSLQSNSESEDDEDVWSNATSVILADHPPSVLLAAHNGLRFDFCMLLFELVRNGLDTAHLAEWFFLDTLVVVNSMPTSFHAGCTKLQCLVRRSFSSLQMRAHRALDDCVVLKIVMEDAAALFGVSLSDFFRRFALQLDTATATVYMNCLVT